MWPHPVRRLAGLALGMWASLACAAGEVTPALLAAGRAIYLEGRLPSGAPLVATRKGSRLEGPAAACAQCHQRSGMGLAEGAVFIPPITGPALFEKHQASGDTPRRAPGMVFRDYPFRSRQPYDAAKLAQAIRNGRYPGGEALHPLMPRYDLPDSAMAALVAYLRSLSAEPSAGVEGGTVHFATVVAPGVGPAHREAMLAVLESCFAERQPGTPAGEPPAWRLHVWDLDGASETWPAQLARRYAAQPVFALIAGLGDEEWSPVDAFCEAQGLPCLFPAAPPPASAGTGRMNFYFSRGVWLEADVFALHLGARKADGRAGRVLQLVNDTQWSRGAAASLARTLVARQLSVETRQFAGGGAALDGLGPDDILVVWLADAELEALVRAVPVPSVQEVLLSGIFSGMENAPLNSAWRQRVRLAYPYDAPGRWQVRMRRNLRPWLARHGLAHADERLQGDTLAACNILAESMLRLRGHYLRDYLVEWVENYPSGMGNAPAPQAYPRFSLGPGQRVSSKGAYLVRLGGPDGRRVEPVQDDWLVP